MKKRPAFLLMLLLVGAALTGGADRALAAGVNCWQNYQACLGTCATGNTACRQNCFEWYNVCRGY